MLDPVLVGILGVLAMLVLLAVGVDVAIALGAVSLGGLVMITNFHAAISLICESFYSTTSNSSFIVLPLFIAMGNFASASGVAERAYVFAEKWLSGFRGGLYMVTIGASALFAAASGSSTATTMTIGKTVLPEMEKFGYDKKYSVACVACSGTLGVLIPPSVIMVIYGIVTGEPVGHLLIAGILPGILSAFIYMIGVYTVVRLRPALAPKAIKYSWGERIKTIKGLWGVVILFGVMIGGIYTGIFTPNEAGAIGSVVALIILFGAKKKYFMRELKGSVLDTAMTVAMMFFIVITATTFTKFLTISGVLDEMIAFVEDTEMSNTHLMAIFIAVCVVFGMFLSATASLLLIAPVAHSVLLPLGYDGIWLGVIMIKIFELAIITPPIGLNVFIASSLVPELEITEVFKGISLFAVLDIITIVILIIFPEISLWLPSMVF